MAAERQVHADRPGTSSALDGRASARRARDAAARRPAGAGPAFINDVAEEHHYQETLHDPTATDAAKADARVALARLHEERGQYAEAVELYERNVWAGARTPATYAGLAAAYRALGRHDLAEAALEQVRRQGGARPEDRPADPTHGRTGAPQAERDRSAGVPRHRSTPAALTGAEPDLVRSLGMELSDATSAVLDEAERAIGPFLAGRAGRRTLVASTVLLPIVLGIGVFAAVVLTATRPRAVEEAPAPTATAVPVATAVPTPAATSAIPAVLAEPPASARRIVANVGTDGLSVRRSPGVGERIKVWPEGTELADLGEAAEHSGKTWRRVRDPDGNVGWVAAEFLADPAGAATPAGPAAAPYASGGLGLARPDWERTHGQPTRSSIFMEYAGGRLIVGFMENNVGHIERVWTPREAVALDAARQDVRTYLPADAVLSQSVDRGDGRVIDVHTSPTLASRFPANSWNGGRSGFFSIQYRFRSATDRMVTSAMFRLGDAVF